LKISVIYFQGNVHLLLEILFTDGRTLFCHWFSIASRPHVWVHTRPPIQWVTGALSVGIKRQGREADHFHLVPKSRMRGAIPPLTIGVLDFDSRRVLGIFLFTTSSRTDMGPTQPPNQWVPAVLSLGIKWPGREADHSPPSSAEVKNAWSYTSTLPVCLHGVVLS
jgi:hypothetical protein